jgi:steroid 5-alpha reductase family enzyme
MDRAARNALLAIPASLLAGAGLAWAGSTTGLRVGAVPVFALAIGLAFAIQWVAFLPAYVLKTERFYDLTGSLTYISVVTLAVVSTGRNDVRGLLLLGMVCLWATRLGSFLFRRVLRAGRDDRFADVKGSFVRFLAAWTLQGLWISFTLAAALAAMTAQQPRSVGPVAWIGLGVWLAGLAIEAIADDQKRRFRADPAHHGDFIRTGLWSRSRHPNYFGEIVLWAGVAIVAAPALSGWQWATLISPVFVTLLLTRISGIPILERRADARWAGLPEYETYRRETPVLLPRLLGRRRSERTQP